MSADILCSKFCSLWREEECKPLEMEFEKREANQCSAGVILEGEIELKNFWGLQPFTLFLLFGTVGSRCGFKLVFCVRVWERERVWWGISWSIYNTKQQNQGKVTTHELLPRMCGTQEASVFVSNIDTFWGPDLLDFGVKLDSIEKKSNQVGFFLMLKH